ncbi:MAG: SMC-Scp complex subunit ScpB [Planctomycetota bacterium]
MISQDDNQEQAEDESGDEEDERIISIDDARQPSDGKEETPRKEDSDHDSAAAPKPGELDFEEIKTICEALLFAAAEPLSTPQLSKLSGAGSESTVADSIEALQSEYKKREKPYTIHKISGGYRLLTRPEFDTWVGKLRQKEQTDSLSQAAMETLAIVAYRQPVLRADIEDIRGVQSGYILRSLIEKSLVKVVGRSEELGRPLLYGTTDDFLDAFGLASVEELPSLEDLKTDEG